MFTKSQVEIYLLVSLLLCASISSTHTMDCKNDENCRDFLGDNQEVKCENRNIEKIIIKANSETDSDFEGRHRKKPHTITLAETVTKSIDANEIIINFSIVTNDPSAAVALVNNNIISEKAIQAILALGIEKSKITTVSFTVVPNYQSVFNSKDNTYTSVLVGYQVTNNLTVKVTGIELAGKIIDAIVQAGGLVNAINFTVDDRIVERIKRELIREAANKITRRAQTTAHSFDLKIVDVIHIFVDPIINDQPIHLFDRVATSAGSQVNIFNSNSYQVSLTLQAEFWVVKN
jgi:uncharacterized protein YggE